MPACYHIGNSCLDSYNLHVVWKNNTVRKLLCTDLEPYLTPDIVGGGGGGVSDWDSFFE